MSDPRQLEVVKAKLRRGTELALAYPGATLTSAECHELLSALDALEAAQRDLDKYPMNRNIALRKELQVAEDALEAANKALEQIRLETLVDSESMTNIPSWLENLVDTIWKLADDALAGGGHEPEQEEQDVGTTASQSSVVTDSCPACGCSLDNCCSEGVCCYGEAPLRTQGEALTTTTFGDGLTLDTLQANPKNLPHLVETAVQLLADKGLLAEYEEVLHEDWEASC